MKLLQSFQVKLITFELVLLLVLLSIYVYYELTGSLVYAPLVHLTNGRVRGIVQQVIDGESVYLYQGIRYGRSNRFSKPRAAESWSSVYDATYPRVACPMIGLDIPDKRYYTKTYSEDCLLLNVWRPVTEPQNGPRAVMFYIYGGGFTTGSIFKLTHDGRYIAGRGDVVVVSVNYRMGPFGFLYSGTEDAPGNVALHDVILGLQWVRDNIEHFGGDPTRVTIFGNSAGSAMVGALTLSPLATGLFRRAILQSGVPINMAIDQNKALQITQTFLQTLNCPTFNLSESLQCAKQKSVENILNVSNALGDPFTIIYGDEVNPLSAKQALLTGKFNRNIDLMFGVVNNEGSSFLGDYFPEIMPEENFNLTLEETKRDIMIYVYRKYGLTNATDIAEMYTAELNENSDRFALREALVKAAGDIAMDCPLVLTAEHFALQAPDNRYYSWRLTKRVSVHVMGACRYHWMGVCHADELFYLFSIPDQTKPDEFKLSQDMIHAWTLFGSTGDPGWMNTVKWKEAFERPIASGTNMLPITRHMVLDPANYTMVDGFYHNTCDIFWDNIIFS